MENRDVDVFVISYNKLRYLKKLIAWLESAEFEKIHVVDNASTYPPLVSYLQTSSHVVHRLEKNFGHLAVWECGLFENILRSRPYIVTDADVLPIEECPKEVVRYFWHILRDYPRMTKVGFALKIDDIPDTYIFKKNVVEWENRFWKKPMGRGVYEASIDTTFALYRPGIYPIEKQWWKSIRTGFPYMARHLPWYEDSSLPKNEEDKYYERHLKKKSSFWSVTDPELLEQYNKDLVRELLNLYAMRRWKILSFLYRMMFFVTRKERFLRKSKKKDSLFESVDGMSAEQIQQRNIDILSTISSTRKLRGWKTLERIGV